jgi:hypothetical protein
MPEFTQVLRFAVGSAIGERSRTWRLWVPTRKSDLYISGRRIGDSVKVSLHEPGPSRFALTKEWVERKGFQPPQGRNSGLAVEWVRPRPRPPRQIARVFSVIVPWDEVLDREVAESGQIVWVPPPPEGTCVHFDFIYTPAGAAVTGHPGGRSMGTKLVGQVQFENGQRVFITWIVRSMSELMRRQVEKLRSAPILSGDGKPMQKVGMLAFGTEPNPDAQDGTFIGMFLDVTRNG